MFKILIQAEAPGATLRSSSVPLAETRKHFAGSPFPRKIQREYFNISIPIVNQPGLFSFSCEKIKFSPPPPTRGRCRFSHSATMFPVGKTARGKLPASYFFFPLLPSRRGSFARHYEFSRCAPPVYLTFFLLLDFFRLHRFLCSSSRAIGFRDRLGTNSISG